MPFLYFRPRTPPTTLDPKWQSHLHTILSLIQTSSTADSLHQIHAQLIRTCLIQGPSSVAAARLIASVATTHNLNLNLARRIFDQLHHPTTLAWNSIIRAYAQNSFSADSLLLYQQMLCRGCSPDSYTYPVAIKAASHLHALRIGETLHGQVLRCGFEFYTIVMSGFVTFYFSCGRAWVARKVFDEMPERDVVSWTRMVSGYAQLGCLEDMFRLFDEMRKEGVEPNNVTVASLLSGCGNVRELGRGKWVHTRIVDAEMEADAVVGNALIDMYAKCGCMSSALRVFRNVYARADVVSWNILIGGFTQNGFPAEALALFGEMVNSDVRPNEITLVNAISACAQLGNYEQGKLLHAYLEENNISYSIIIGNALINMHSKCGKLDEAVHVFHEMHDKDIFSWTALVSGYVQGAKYQEALKLFQDMQLAGVEPNEVTLVSLLSACAQLGALDQGKWIHAYIVEHGLRQDVVLGTALIDMYVKCGCLERALKIFYHMPQKDNFSWNALIGGLAMHGHGKEAIILFSQMQRVVDVIPDRVTFMSVLCACTHSGLVREGYYFFNSMYALYGIRPSIEHYGCMVDLLGKAGHLEEAVEFIERMPVEPNHIVWATLLSACCIHRNVEIGEKVAQEYIKLAPDDEGVYVLISNLYAEAGRWDGVRRVRTLMGSRGIEKSPGCSLIEVDGIIQEFHVRGMMHHASNLIYSTLDCLTFQSKDIIFKESEYGDFHDDNSDAVAIK